MNSTYVSGRDNGLSGKCGHGNGKRGHGKGGHGKGGHGKRGHEKRGHEKRGHGKRGHGKTDMENADKHIKNSCMIDGLPCNRFGLPEKFHVSSKY